MKSALKHNISVSSPVFLGREKEYVLDCLESVQLSSVGPYVERFEKAFATACGVPHAVSCSSGTAALHLALLALGIRKGDYVYLPALTYVATANAVRYVGATPVFCDVLPDTWCLDPASVGQAILSHSNEGWSEVILPVHLYGAVSDMVAFRQLAEDHDTYLVEDAAEAHGAFIPGLGKVGSLSDATIFSFYGNKILTCGEGGMATTKDSRVDSDLRLYRGQGVKPGTRYEHEVVGYNYRLTNIQAAIGLAQLECLSEHLRLRNVVFDTYRAFLPDTIQTQRRPEGSSDWMFTVLVPEGVDRENVRKWMLEDRIDTRPVFTPMTDLPMYKGETPPVTADIAKRGINLPTHAGLTERDVFYIVEDFMWAVGR